MRTVVSTMERAEDLERVIALIQDELRSLGVACDDVGLNIVEAVPVTVLDATP